MSREIKKHIIEERIKKVLSLEKELQANHKAQFDLGYIVLDKPIRDGWFRTFELRPDIAKNKNAKIFQEILNAIVFKVWGREKKSADKNWSKYFKRTNDYYQRSGIKYLDDKEYAKLSSKAKKYFVTFKIKSLGRYRKVNFCTLPKYYFQPTYERAYIWRHKITSPDLESREQEIVELLSSAELSKYSRYHNYGSYREYNLNKSMRRKIKLSLAHYDITTLNE